MSIPDPFHPEHPKRLAESGAFEEARRLLDERLLWKFEDRLDDTGDEGASGPRKSAVPPGSAGALVLEGSPEPHRVLWNQGSWSCECGSSAPCVHLAALLLRLAETRPGDRRLDAVVEALNRPETDSEPARAAEAPWETRDIPPPSDGNPMPLGDQPSAGSPRPGHPFDLDPEQDLLFFSEPVPVETREVAIFGPAAEVEAALAEPLPAAQAPAATPEDDSAVRLKSLMKRTWSLVGAEAVLRHDGAIGRFRRRPEESRSPAAPSAGKAAEASGGSAAFVAIRDALDGRPAPMTPSGLPWTLVPAARLVIRFDPLLSSGSDEPLYEPIPVMILETARREIAGEPPLGGREDSPGDEGGEAQAGGSGSGAPAGESPVADAPADGFPGSEQADLAGDPEAEGPPSTAAGGPGTGEPGSGGPETGPARQLRGDIFAGSGDLIMLDGDTGTAALLAGAGRDLWFLRLVLSRRVMSASDIRARFSDSRRKPEGIDVELPYLPESLEVLPPTPVLEIVGREGHTDLLPRWKYAGVLLAPEEKSDVVLDRSGFRPVQKGLRDREAEAAALEAMERLLATDLAWRRGRYSFLAGQEVLPFRMEADMASVLEEYAGPLMDAGVEIRLENRPIRRGGSLGISAGDRGGLVEMSASVSSEPLELDEWLEKGGLVRTRDSYFRLTPKALEQLRFLRANGMDGGGFLTTSPDNLSLIDAVYDETVAGEELRDDLERRRELYRELADFSPKDAPPPPESFRADLRPYQKLGYAWLLHLGENGLGACLADDMGLGKTVQTLASLSRLRADGKLGNVLLVGPVVTLANWEAEIRRFAPDLSVHRYAGPAEKRILPAEDAGVDIVLVSYQTLRNDAEKFLDREWGHVVLDEAHYVKNASSKIFKTVRSLRAARRISLTGTPLENHLNELWSQMAFLNPGVLGSQSRFVESYVRPVEFGTDEKALSRLSDTVAPFILRRKKEEVLDDLPPKDETVLRCGMTDDQAEAYDAMRDLYQRQVSGLIDREGLEGSRIEILSILSKLRLLAIHPPLAGEPFAGISSGKMAVLDNLLEEILEEDHKILVFSQFLGALDRAEATCRKRDWLFSRLTGSTKDRTAQIKDFNENPENRVFLLSLKAGGVGINLTAADYVVLIDPWWNPAVEAQAVDRAHRMGQTRPVMAYRLITSDTIEEKVLDLQERKKDLISGVLGEGGVPKLSEEDIMGLLD